MDVHLQKLKRATVQNPSDAEGLHRYIAALERAFGVQSSEIIGLNQQHRAGGVRMIKYQRRPGWECPDPDYEKHSWNDGPYEGPSSPDGICVCESEPSVSLDPPRRLVRLMIDGKDVLHLLPESYTGHIDGESDDWCIFCGQPDERK